MELEPRRVARPEPEEPGSEPALVERIAAEISRGGPMTFARFMELALYDEDHGYYRGASARPGREGDFLTSPEAHPIFGWAVARQLEEVWRVLGSPDPFVVREAGAGTGALAAAVLGGFAREFPSLLAAVRYEPVELDERRLDALRERVAGAGHPGAIAPPASEPIHGVVLANELLDALPVHLLEQRGGVLREVHLDLVDGHLVEVLADPSTPALAERLSREGIALAEGQRAEVCLAVDGWIAAAAGWLGRGLLLLIDYGYPAAELYDPSRRFAGTLLAYSRHRVHGDPYRNVGRQDLTAHVDLTAVERAAATSGLVPLGSATQAEFLAALGAGDLLVALQADGATTLQSYLEARSALMRMLDPAVTGRFRVLAFGRGLPNRLELRGFSPGHGHARD